MRCQEEKEDEEGEREEEEGKREEDEKEEDEEEVFLRKNRVAKASNYREAYP